MPDGPCALTVTTLLIAAAAIDVAVQHMPPADPRRPAYLRTADRLHQAAVTHPDRKTQEES